MTTLLTRTAKAACSDTTALRTLNELLKTPLTEALLKNIQVIDGAVNCEFPVYAATNDEFDAIFPLPDQDLELIEDFIARIGDERARTVLEAIWGRPVDKKKLSGIQGTLFYEREADRSHFPPSRREADWQTHTIRLLRDGG
jgi:hypothetical protein